MGQMVGLKRGNSSFSSDRENGGYLLCWLGDEDDQ